MPSYPRLSFTNARSVILPALESGAPVLLMGSAGVGKSALANDLAREMRRHIWTVIASLCDVTDFGGFPVVQDDGAFDRIPMRAIREASKKAGILFLDEISNCPGQIQASLLRGIHEGWFGDVQVHPDTMFFAAANPPDQAPDGNELTAPLIGRFAVYDFRPTIDEVRTYFEQLGSEDSILRELALDFAATTQNSPDLVQMDPPQAAVTEGDLWGSPRDWERALTTSAFAGDVNDDTSYLILAGSVGEPCAAAYMAIRRLRDHLPSVQGILDDPHNALLPKDPATQIGALGLLANVAQKDAWAAWIYAARCVDEVSAACARALFRRDVNKAPKRWIQDGQRARVKLLARIGRELGA